MSWRVNVVKPKTGDPGERRVNEAYQKQLIRKMN